MLKKFYPKKYVKSTYSIDFEKCYEKGFRGVLFDIDNTLVPHGEPADEKAVELFKRLDEIGFKYCLISNNKGPRIIPFAKAVGAKNYIVDAHKPMVKSYKKAMELMETDETNSMFVGDQIFTDVFGANLAHMYTILVKPIHPKEEIQIVLKRYLEKIVLRCYLKDKKKKGNTSEK